MNLSELSDKIMPVFVPIIALVSDFVVAYSTYFIIATPEIPWLWVFPLFLICIPVLFIFNRGAIEFIKGWFKKK